MIKKLLKHLKQYKNSAIFAPIFVLFEVAITAVIPLLMQWTIDEAKSPNPDMMKAVMYGLIVLGLTAFGFFVDVMAAKTASRASTGLEANLRFAMYDRIQNFSFANVDKFSTGSLLTRLTTDATSVKDAFQQILRVAVRAPISIVFAVVMCFIVKWEMGIVFLVVAPLFMGIFVFLISIVMRRYERVRVEQDKLNVISQENLQAMRVVKSNVREGYEITKFRTQSEIVIKRAIDAQKIMFLGWPVFSFGLYFCILVVYAVGGMWIIEGSHGMTTGMVVSLISYGMQVLFSILMLTMCLVTFSIAKVSARRIIEVLDESPSIVECSEPVTEVKSGKIVFENVSFGYYKTSELDGHDKKSSSNGGDGLVNTDKALTDAEKVADKTVLTDINLEIASGETVGILGGTGSGKTSLVNLIPRFYDVTGGRITVGDVNVADYSLDALRHNVSCVLQKNVLFSGTIEENLKWGKEDATHEEIVEACKKAQALEFIESFPDGFNTNLGQGGVNVSGGQKQRLCIARALLREPKIIIFDDSTSAVDTKTDALIQAELRSSMKNVTKLIIAQRVSSVEHADKIVVMNEGKILAVGKHKELLKTCDVYKEVYETQTKKKVVGG